MKIANPIYDSVFKHLMENQEIARGLISRLLGVEVLSLVPKAQEMTQQHASVIAREKLMVRVFRVDFAAEVRLVDGRVQKVLIELQKAQAPNVIERFRAYLGSHYAIPASPEPSLPIIAIYLLGFMLNQALPKVIKVKRQYLDGVNGTALPAGMTDHFIEMLTHDAVVVQIPLLDDSAETEIERALLVFNQQHKDQQNPHYLVIEQEPSKDPLVEKMVRALLAAAVDDDTKREMGMEDELERVFADNANAKAAAAEAIRQREEERRQKEAAMQRVAELEEKLRKLEGP